MAKNIYTGNPAPGRVSEEEAMKRRAVNRDAFLNNTVSKTKMISTKGTAKGFMGKKGGK